MDGHLGKVQGTAASRGGRETEAKDQRNGEDGGGTEWAGKEGNRPQDHCKLLLPVPIY